jgi:hypothetical protein
LVVGFSDGSHLFLICQPKDGFGNAVLAPVQKFFLSALAPFAQSQGNRLSKAAGCETNLPGMP